MLEEKNERMSTGNKKDNNVYVGKCASREDSS
jgi:hypothetical protein